MLGGLEYRSLARRLASRLGSALVGFLQSGSGAVARTAQAKAREIVSVTDFGATGDGTTDDTAAIQAAIDAHPGRVIFFPEGTYLVSNITITSPVVLEGEVVAHRISSGKTQVGSILKAKTGSTGVMIDVSRGSTYWNYEGQLYGVGFKRLYIDGNARSVDVSAIKLDRVDSAVIDDVYFEDVKYSALVLHTGVRESWFRFHTRYCGSIADDKPTVDLRMGADSTVHNNLRFNQCFLVYSLGNSIEIDKFTGAASGPTQINFENCYVHGVTSANDTDPYTFSAAQKTLSHLVIGAAGRINSINTRWFVGGGSAPTIHLDADADSGAGGTILSVIGGEVSQHYTSAGSYDAFKVEAGTLILDGVTTIGNAASVRQSGGSVYISPSCDLNEAPVLIANAIAQKWRMNRPEFTRTGGALGAGTTNLGVENVTYSGHSGGTTDARANIRTVTASGGNATASSMIERNILSVTASANTTNSYVYFNSVANAGTATLLTAAVYTARLDASSSGGMTTAYNYRVNAPSLTSTGVISALQGFSVGNIGHATLVTAAVAFKADDITASATSARGIQLSLASGTGKHNIYADGTAVNYMKGGLSIGSTTVNATGTQVLTMASGTAPDAGVADSVQFYSSDNSAGNTIPSFYCEGSEVIATGQADSTSSVRVKMRINGTVVTLLAI